jgi:hypothetical protein
MTTITNIINLTLFSVVNIEDVTQRTKHVLHISPHKPVRALIYKPKRFHREVSLTPHLLHFYSTIRKFPSLLRTEFRGHVSFDCFSIRNPSLI